MSPILSNLVTTSSSVQRLSKDDSKRALAFLLTAYGAGAYGQSLPLTSANTSLAATAKSVASKFQGFNMENFLDIMVYQTAVAIRAYNPQFAGIALPSTDGAAINTLVNTYWGNPNGVVDAQEVDALLMYGALIQAGTNLQNLLS